MPPTPLREFRPALLGAALSLSVFALVACKREAPAAAPVSEPAQPVEASTAPVQQDTSPAFVSTLSEGMPYARLREAVMAAGWVPLRDPACRENVGSEATACNVLPETESCSGDGVCTMRFADPADGRSLQVTAYGPYARWNQPGEEATFAVRSWALDTANPAAARAACAATEDFDAFLKRYASDEAVRKASTAPVIELGELYADAQGNDAARTVHIAASDYRDFDIVYRDGAFHFVDAAGAVDPSPLPLKIESPSPDIRLVRFVYGMSEGNAYRFENRNGCWTMTGDPEPPSP
jgi:hypothetical protein